MKNEWRRRSKVAAVLGASSLELASTVGCDAPLSCPAKLVAPVVGSITASRSEPRQADRVLLTSGSNVTYQCDLEGAVSDTDGPPTQRFTCWVGGRGTVRLQILAGERALLREVEVPTTEDGCHPETQTVSVDLDPVEESEWIRFSGSCGELATVGAREPSALNLARTYAGRYHTPISYAGPPAYTCEQPADGALQAVVEPSETDDALGARPCGANSIPVNVELTSDDGRLDQRRAGQLSEDGRIALMGATAVAADAPSLGSLVLHPGTSELTLGGSPEDVQSLPGCCAEPPTDAPGPAQRLDELGLVNLREAFEQGVIGPAGARLRLEVEHIGERTLCTEQGRGEEPVQLRLFGPRGELVLEVRGRARARACDGGPGFTWEAYGRGDLESLTSLGEGQPLLGTAFGAGITAEFDGCQSPPASTFSLELDVALADSNREARLVPSTDGQ